MCSPQHPLLITLVMKFHDRQSSERIRKLISRHCFEKKTRTRWNDFLFLITYDRDFRPQTCTNGLVLRECKHIKNIFEDVYFTKNSFHITFKIVFFTFLEVNMSNILWSMCICKCTFFPVCRISGYVNTLVYVYLAPYSRQER